MASMYATGNVVQIEELWNGANSLVNSFAYDRAKDPRHECRGYSEHDIAAVGVTVEHAYDGLGRRRGGSPRLHD